MIVRSTLSAIRKDWLINIVAIMLLSLLFCSELSLYHYMYYRSYVIDERNNTNLAASTYTVSFEDPVSRDMLDRILNGMPGTCGMFEDVAIRHRMVDDVISTDLISFYHGMSPLHDFRSEDTGEKFTNQLMESENVIGTVDIDINETKVIEGKEYRLVQCIRDLNYYSDRSEVFCCSESEFWRLSDKVDRLYIEYRMPLSGNETMELKQYLRQFGNITFQTPDVEFVRSVKTVSDIAIELVEIIIVMFIITTCVLPIIRYCLWKRHYEFASYRICGADQSFIISCELTHVLFLGLISVIIGTLLIWGSIQTRGFWLLLIAGILIFLLRILLEVVIDSRSSSKIMEVNKKWRL